ncbi:MAG: hypothetical protein ACRDG8_09670 [Actinomycetota bacterium]
MDVACHADDALSAGEKLADDAIDLVDTPVDDTIDPVVGPIVDDVLDPVRDLVRGGDVGPPDPGDGDGGGGDRGGPPIGEEPSDSPMPVGPDGRGDVVGGRGLLEFGFTPPVPIVSSASGTAPPGPADRTTGNRLDAALGGLARSLAIVLVLFGLAVAFVAIQDRLDRGDPRLALAPVESDVVDFA